MAAGTNHLDGIQSLYSWVRAIQQSVSASRRAVKAICMHRQSNIMVTGDVVMPPVTLTNVLECGLCAKVLPSVQQLKFHRLKHHGIIRQARRFVGALNSCPACLRRYPTRTQAIRHVTNYTHCAGYDDFAEEMTDEVIHNLEVAENSRIQALLKSGGFSCSARRSLPNVVGRYVLNS